MYDFILTCFLIKNQGQTTSDTELAILPDTPVCISTVQVQCQLFPPTFIFNIVTLMALIKSSCLVKENILAGKQCSQNQQSLQPQTSNMPANYRWFRRSSKTSKPTVSLVILTDGSWSSPEVVHAHKDVNFTTYSTHMIFYRYGKRLRRTTNVPPVLTPLSANCASVWDARQAFQATVSCKMLSKQRRELLAFILTKTIHQSQPQQDHRRQTWEEQPAHIVVHWATPKSTWNLHPFELNKPTL